MFYIDYISASVHFELDEDVQSLALKRRSGDTLSSFFLSFQKILAASSYHILQDEPFSICVCFFLILVIIFKS